MRRPRTTNLVLETLRRELRGWPPPRPDGTLVFTPPPVFTEEEYAGVRLKSIIVPGRPKSIRPLAEMFDCLILRSPWKAGLTNTVIRYVAENPVNVLAWASEAVDADLDMDLDAGRIMVIGSYTFGFADGKAYGLSTVQPFDQDLRELAQPKPVRTKDTGFLALYKRAKALKSVPAMRALEALRAYKNRPWRDLAPWVWRKEHKADLSELGEIIYMADDPIADLYMSIVPHVVDAQEFKRIFGPTEGRPINPDKDTRLIMWRRLSALLSQ